MAVLVLALPIFLFAGGCDVGDIGADGNGLGSGKGLPDPGCDGPLGKPRDPSALPACCTDSVGGAHCLPSDVIPSQLKGFLAECPSGGACVPDPFIETGGVYTPKACKSLSNADGVCLSGCIPQVAQYLTLLPQDVCADDERCAPCVNPLDGTTTGACQISFACGQDPNGGDGGGGGPGPATCPHSGPPVIDPSTLTSCGADAHCLADALVPPAMAAKLAACPDNVSKCVPDVFIAAGGNYIPATCHSVAGAEGRCLSKVLPDVQAKATLLPKDTCTDNELCAPCYDPLSGMDTGACHLSCDPGPGAGPTKLPTCCDGRGTCVPSSAAGDKASQLGQDSCPDAMGGADQLICAPDVFLMPGYKPPACDTGLLGVLLGDKFKPGVCLPDCIPAVSNFLIGRGDCADKGDKCAPCLNPLTGEPSGACDL
ncbi:MAG TPA: hypothetical protein VL463_06785 [Kofleriaceae bacterium]|nr:hypothetical protein [Kofleriaceae bacterium]